MIINKNKNKDMPSSNARVELACSVERCMKYRRRFGMWENEISSCNEDVSQLQQKRGKCHENENSEVPIIGGAACINYLGEKIRTKYSKKTRKNDQPPHFMRKS